MFPIDGVQEVEINSAITLHSQHDELSITRAMHARSILLEHGIPCKLEVNGKQPHPFTGGVPQSEMHFVNITPEVDLSVVIPLYNEESNINELYRRLKETLDRQQISYEIVFVDDGSRDSTSVIMNELHNQDCEHIRCIFLSRNFGHQPAVSAGLKYALGKAVIVMDADLQDPPEVIPSFIAKWKEGYEVVYAVREKRKEGLLKRIAYHTFYRILRRLSRIEMPLDSGDFGLMDRCVVDVIKCLPESNRFIRGLRSWSGFRQVGLAYERDARYAGKTNYTFRKLVNLALTGLISFSYLPLRLATILGMVFSGISLILTIYYFTKAVTVGIGLPGFATSVILISLLGGVQLITLGIIGEYIGQILDEVKHRPPFVVRRVLGFDQERINGSNGHF